MNINPRILVAVLIAIVSFLIGCGGAESSSAQAEAVIDNSPIVVEEPANKTNGEFSVKAHDSNVLMVKAKVITAEATKVSIQYQSAATVMRADA